MAVDSFGMPIRFFVTAGTVADCTFGEKLIADLKAQTLLADRGYDADAIIRAVMDAGMEVDIPPRSNRKAQRYYDKDLYKLRHLVENAFLELRRWRAVATRYAKQTASFVATIQIRCVFLWLAIIA
jgi:transposase